MMTDIESVVQKACIDILSKVPGGTTALYTPNTGDPISDLQVHLGTSDSMQIAGFESESWTTEISIDIPLHLISNRMPEYGETLLVDGTTYTIREVSSFDPYWVRVRVKK